MFVVWPASELKRQVLGDILTGFNLVGECQACDVVSITKEKLNLVSGPVTLRESLVVWPLDEVAPTHPECEDVICL